jgi:uncharacterized protein YcfJ
MNRMLPRRIIGAVIGVPFGALIGGANLHVLWAVIGAIGGGLAGVVLAGLVGKWIDTCRDSKDFPSHVPWSGPP